MNFLNYILLWLCSLLICISLNGQEVTKVPSAGKGIIQGIIKTSDGQPAELITVVLKENLAGTLTTPKGFYCIETLPGEYTLIVQSIVCHKQEFKIQIKEGENIKMPDITLIETNTQLKELVVTGQYTPQSVNNSVYKVRTVNASQIQARNATDIKSILNCEAGIRFSNDLATGESDIELMGMSGHSIKILLDGVPIIDRGSSRQSLSHIDVNSIERIEIVEGPMSVIYGTDALAGVINIITKKKENNGILSWSVSAKIQEETVGDEYKPFDGEGIHYESLILNSSLKKGWTFGAGLTRNNFGGWQGEETGRAKSWAPKDQWLSNFSTSYAYKNFKASYRLDYLNEDIQNLGDVNSSTNTATDADYITNRYTHQAHFNLVVNPQITTNLSASWQDYSRKTQTTILNLTTGERTLTLDEDDQSESLFNSAFARATVLYRINKTISMQPGLEYKRDEASGERIQGNPIITDYSAFVSGEINPVEKLIIKPGLRFSKNSTYDAPPVIPSISVKYTMGSDWDVRLSYARGFRAPALRELYFWFFNSSHAIKGNPDLEAEHSYSYTGALSWRIIHNNKFRLTSNLNGFYNHFDNLITTAKDANDASVYTYVNIDKFKTTGSTFDLTLNTSNLNTNLGFTYVGSYNIYSSDEAYTNQNSTEFTWSPEVLFSLIYQWTKPKINFNLSYKYTGIKPEYEVVTTDGVNYLHEAKISDYNWLDISINKQFGKSVSLSTGIKNIFNVTTINNTSQVSSGHNSTGPSPLSYGRSCFIGLSLNLNSK